MTVPRETRVPAGLLAALLVSDMGGHFGMQSRYKCWLFGLDDSLSFVLSFSLLLPGQVAYSPSFLNLHFNSSPVNLRHSSCNKSEGLLASEISC